jgi:hypothetical protein
MSFSPPTHDGVRHASGPDGRRLPIIDITHPAFAVNLDEAQLDAKIRAHIEEQRRRDKLPGWVQRLMFRIFLRKSVLGRSLRQARGGFLDGLSTYRLKLGPDNLDPAWASPIDRTIAASLPCLSLRLRLQDTAQFLASDLAPRLNRHPGKPLYLVNIAGGPSMDSLNALILLRKRNPDDLKSRAVHIHVLDQDQVGPAFAGRALAALRTSGAPLADVDVTLTHVPYRWTETESLREHLRRLPADIVTAASSEGGLFDYGSDDEIAANLKVLREQLPAETVMAGSVTRADAPATPLRSQIRFSTRPRTLAAFEAVVENAGWRLAASLTRPFSYTVLLKKTDSRSP